MKFPARSVFRLKKGFTPVIIIVVVVIVGIMVIGIVSGALKGSFKISKNGQQAQQAVNTEQTTKKAPEEKVSPSPQIKQVQSELTETYTNSQMGFSVNYPKSWILDESSPKSPTIYVKDEGANNAKKSAAGVILTSSPLGSLKGSQLSTVADLVKVSQIKSQFPGSEITADRPTKLGSMDAHIIEFTFTQGTDTYESRFYLAIDSKNLYGIMATGEKSKFPKYEETLRAIAQTFKLI